MYRYDNRVVITLDAGGTNLVFGAMQANKFIVDPITLPSNADNLDKCLATMVEGFQAIIDKLEEKPVAISFAFPGPADYPNGIIGGYLPNFPSFREGVALGPFLEYKFGIPVFINNDGDLFSYGEALGGALPEVNARLEALGSPKRYKNLVGYTFGTGLGIGIVVNNELNRGDNSCVETFCLKHKKMPDIIVEDGAAIRAVKRVYGELTGNPNHGLEPKDLCDIADGNTRELHTELAKGAIDYTVLPDYRTKYEQVQDRETELVSCPYFTTSLCDLTAPLTLDYAALDSFVVVICVEGKGMIADDSGNEMPIHQGETVLLPATVKSLRVVPEGKLKMLTSCIK